MDGWMDGHKKKLHQVLQFFNAHFYFNKKGRCEFLKYSTLCLSDGTKSRTQICKCTKSRITNIWEKERIFVVFEKMIKRNI